MDIILTRKNYINDIFLLSIIIQILLVQQKLEQKSYYSKNYTKSRGQKVLILPLYISQKSYLI